jgi:peptidoglycan/LPS O-acetylase OafA/YrhL
VRTSKSLNYRPDIDGLRAIAVLSVVFFHAFPDQVPGGFIGVDIFFVISGYLISSIIFKSLATGDFSFADFYVRRVKRIFPALLLVIAVCMFIGWHSLFPDEYAALAKHSAAGIGFISNFVFWQESGYFDVEAETKPLLHLWSLGVEEQFYIFFPLLICVLWRIKRAVPFTLFVLFCISLVLSISMSQQHPAFSYFLPMTRIWELLAGSILAWFLSKTELGGLRERKEITSLLATVGLAGMIFGLFFIDKSKAFPGYLALLPVAGATLIILSGPSAWINNNLLSTRVLVWVGLISFPLYLWHWPILSLLRVLYADQITNLVLVAAILLAVGLSWATYRLIERPIRVMTGKRAITSLTVIATTLLAISLNFHARDGIVSRMKNAQSEQDLVALSWPDRLKNDEGCHSLLTFELKGNCLIEDKSRQPNAVIIGDSHANHFFWGLSSSLAKQDINLLQLSKGGCVSLLGLEIEKYSGEVLGCLNNSQKIFEYVLKNKSIELVFLASRWPTAVTGKQFQDLGRTDSAPRDYPVLISEGVREKLDRGAVVQRALHNTLEQLQKAGKKVVVLDSVPELRFKARDCVEWVPNAFVKRTRNPDCHVPRVELDARVATYRPYLDKPISYFPHTILIDPRYAFCDAQYCYGRRGSRLMYRDDDHLSVDGSNAAGSYIAGRLATLNVIKRSKE